MEKGKCANPKFFSEIGGDCIGGGASSNELVTSLTISPDEVHTNMTRVLADGNVQELVSGVTTFDHVRDQRFTLASGSPFHVLDVRVVEQRMAKWRHFMPRVDPFYAMKCNTDPVLMRTLFAHGAGFDCASRREIELALELGCAPQRIIFANPAKLVSDLHYAASVGVTMMTFDNNDELDKIAAVYQQYPHLRCQPVLRIVTDDSHSVCKFSLKFGASFADCEHLLTHAARLGLAVIGVSFHVGSNCNSVYSYTKAVTDARKVFNMGAGLGHPMHFLDLGGGWAGDDNVKVPLPLISYYLTPLLNRLFPPTQLGDEIVVAALTGEAVPPVHIIAEPGRYFSYASMHFATPIIARRVNSKLPSWTATGAEAQRQPHVLYYIGDGVYGAFNCMFYDHAVLDTPHAFMASPERQSQYERALTGASDGEVSEGSDSDSESSTEPSARAEAAAASERGLVRAKVFGPTCDGLDCIFQEVPLPMMEVGEWLVFRNMGAYTVAAQSSFNGIPRPPLLYVRSSACTQDFDFAALAAKHVPTAEEARDILDRTGHADLVEPALSAAAAAADPLLELEAATASLKLDVVEGDGDLSFALATLASPLPIGGLEDELLAP